MDAARKALTGRARQQRDLARCDRRIPDLERLQSSAQRRGQSVRETVMQDAYGLATLGCDNVAEGAVLEAQSRDLQARLAA